MKTNKVLIEVDVPEGVSLCTDTTYIRVVNSEGWGRIAYWRIIDQAAAVPAIWQFRHNDRIGGAWSNWVECDKPEADDLESGKDSVKFEYRAIYATPPAVPAAQPSVDMHLSQKLIQALKRLSFAAQTSGGTAGPDSELMAAIANAEQAVSLVSISQSIDAVELSAQPQEPAAQDELLQAAKVFYNMTIADAEVIIRPPSAEKQNAIAQAGQRLREAIQAQQPSGARDE